MCRLQGRDDPLQARQRHEGIQTLVVRGRGVLDPVDVFQKAVLGPDTRVVQPRGDRIHRQRIALLVLQVVALEAMQGARGAQGQGRGVIRGIESPPRRLDSHQLHILIVEKRGEGADRIRATPDTGRNLRRQTAFAHQKLLARLFTHDLLEITHHHRERMRTHHRADRIDTADRVLEIFLERRIDRVLERGGTACHGHQVTAQDLHLGDVRVFLLDIHLTHVDLTGDTDQGAGRRQRHTMLPGPGLGQHLLLPHVLGQQCLADTMIDLVRTGMVEILAFQEDARTTEFFRQTAGVEQRARATDVIRLQIAQLVLEFPGLAHRLIGRGDLVHHRLELRGNDLAAVIAKVTVFVGHGGGGHLHRSHTSCWGPGTAG